jgi:protein TonB
MPRIGPGHSAAATASFPPGLTLRSRTGLFLVVLTLHTALLVWILMPHPQSPQVAEAPSLETQIVASTPEYRAAPPLPLPVLEHPHIDQITPEVQISVAAPDAPIADVRPPSPLASVAAATTKAAPADPVTPPRYDASFLKNPPPVYPATARRNHEQGTVLLRVRVSGAGAALEVLLEHTSGSAQLDGAALDAVRHWRFLPARRGADPVEAWVLVPIEFALRR